MENGVQHANAKLILPDGTEVELEARAAHAERRGVLLGLSAAAAAALQLPALAADEGMHARPADSSLSCTTQSALTCIYIKCGCF